MTVEVWKRDTDLGRLHSRSKEMEAIDKALKNYHLLGKTEPSFIQLKTAFDNWIRSQERGGKASNTGGRTAQRPASGAGRSLWCARRCAGGFRCNRCAT
jgi:hypothetical protein